METSRDLDDVDNKEVTVMESNRIPSSQQCCETPPDTDAVTTRARPRTADADVSSVRTTSVATQTSFIQEVNAVCVSYACLSRLAN